MKRLTAFVTAALAVLLCFGVISAGAANVGTATSVVRYTGEEASARLTVRYTNTSDTAVSGEALVAVYNEKGAYRFSVKGTLTAAAGETAQLRLTSGQAIEKTDVVRIFWWDESLTPLCEAASSAVHDYLEVLTTDEESSILYSEIKR